jgi:predicted lipid-binding transport protein (Tim44 family)
MVLAIFVIDQNPSGMYEPQTAIGVLVAHAIYVAPWLLIGAAFGFLSGTAMTRASKTLVGAAIGGAIAGVLSLVLLFFAHGRSDLVGQLFLINLLFWALFGAAVGFFSPRRKHDASASDKQSAESTAQAEQWSSADHEEFRRLQRRSGPQSHAP